MKESMFLGALLPSHPDIEPIIQAFRDKYHIPEISPGGEPISEIYLRDEIIPLEEFRQEIENRVRGFGFILPSERIHARPHAGNASRWALAH